LKYFYLFTFSFFQINNNFKISKKKLKYRPPVGPGQPNGFAPNPMYPPQGHNTYYNINAQPFAPQQPQQPAPTYHQPYYNNHAPPPQSSYQHGGSGSQSAANLDSWTASNNARAKLDWFDQE
jgi:hypothetical protein